MHASEILRHCVRLSVFRGEEWRGVEILYKYAWFFPVESWNINYEHPSHAHIYHTPSNRTHQSLIQSTANLPHYPQPHKLKMGLFSKAALIGAGVYAVKHIKYASLPTFPTQPVKSTH